MQTSLPGIDPPDRVVVANMTLEEKTERAIALLREHEPPEGYYLAFSGGKDSCVIKELAKMAGVKFEAWYANVTIDPPELVRFIKQHHADVHWQQPKHGNMFVRIATRVGLPPTRVARWCCDEYKETHGRGRVKIFGVRAAESAKRAHRWSEVTFDSRDGTKAICPIVYWSGWTEVDDYRAFLMGDVWEFIKEHNVPYCSLYDEGIGRLGCVGCMLNPESQAREFTRWPKYAAKWKQAIVSNWENHQGRLRKDGKPYVQSQFATGEDFWKWWLNKRGCDVFRDDCQSGILWTNEN